MVDSPAFNKRPEIAVEVISDAQGWRVSLTLGKGGSRPARRLQRVGEILCDLDALLGRCIARGDRVTVSVPSLDSIVACRPRADGVFGSPDLVRPLLLSLQVDDMLYPYQRRGVAWLLRHRRGLLADDMGLGKSVQALAAARRLVRLGKIRWGLIVAPRTLIANWIAEAKRWAPELCVVPIRATGDGRQAAWRRAVRRGHLLVTSYEQFRDPPEALAESPPDLIIADEAHRLRRLESQATQGFRTVQTKWLWALSGTPVERDAEDLAVLMSLLDSRRFAPSDRDLHPSALSARSRPYMLRRRKTDLLRELPPVIETEEQLELSEAQRAAYRESIRAHAGNAGSASFLALFGELREICDMAPEGGSSSKLDRICELLEDITAKGEKAVVFSHLLAPLRELSRRLEATCGQQHVVLTGDMPLPLRDAAVIRFRTEEACSVMLASSRVASEGLTLVEANHVLFINRWWNPSANAQARDRVVRIGQEKTVWVWTFVCRGTVETRLEKILSDKAKTFDQLVEAIARADLTDVPDLFAGP